MVKPEQGLERIRNNELREFNRLDQEKLSLHQLVYEGYRKIIDDNRNQTIIEVDASKSIQNVVNDVLKIIVNQIKAHYGQ
jgi:dTMP kinase